MIFNKDSFWVFDLDDTLYNEVDYHSSGMNAVRQYVLQTYHADISRAINECKNNDGLDYLGNICNNLNLPLSIKESLLWVYRLHSPTITLTSEVITTLEYVKKKSKGIAILTDGRSISQRLKLKSLCLSEYPAYISEEWGETKPCFERYKVISQQYSAKEFVYVGDNIKKDFLAPNQLGWSTIGLIDNGKNIHSQSISVEDGYQPQIWINQLQEIKKILC